MNGPKENDSAIDGSRGSFGYGFPAKSAVPALVGEPDKGPPAIEQITVSGVDFFLNGPDQLVDLPP